MIAYINLNNIELSKRLLVNKFNMILDNYDRHKRTKGISWVCSEAATGAVL